MSGPASPPVEPPTEPSDTSETGDTIAAELDAVEAALARLDAGTYWTCEVTGSVLPDAILAADPVARRIPAPEVPTPSW